MRMMISVQDALDAVLESAGRPEFEHITTARALGRTLGEDIVSTEQVPPFDNSAMDGFAVRADDVAGGQAVTVTGSVPAGTWPEQEVGAGTCVRIMTGAAIPRGADAVIPIEWIKSETSSKVRFVRDVRRGANIRPAGQDLQPGAHVLSAGSIITPATLGMLAMLGRTSVVVAKKPQVAVIASGDELVDASDTPGPGQIRNSNGPALAAQVIAAGGALQGTYVARDNEPHIRKVLSEALQADVLVFSGGVSVGDYDLIREVLEQEGLGVAFWTVRQRPGKPLLFGRLKGKPVIGLPGNPVSSSVGFDQYVRPLIAQMMGRNEVLRPRFTAVLDAAIPKVAGLHFFSRGVTMQGKDGRLHVVPTGPQGSNLYSSMLRANSLVHLPAEWAKAEAGAEVEIEWLAD